MDRIARVGTILFFIVSLAVSFRVEAQAHGGDPEVPPTSTDCASECASDAFQAYWTNCRCGNDTWNPVRCYECQNDSADGCIDKPMSGAGQCLYDNGKCYGWGTCTYTG